MAYKRRRTADGFVGAVGSTIGKRIALTLVARDWPLAQHIGGSITPP
jgi:hypothetical protein